MGIPAVTAHLLHHRQTIFQGTPDYQTMLPETPYSGCDMSFSNYETLYLIKDQNVEAFSEIITHVCGTALSLLPKTFDCAAHASTESVVSNTSALAMLNNTLITIFENTLQYFETHENTHSPKVIEEMSQRLNHEIRGLMESCNPLHTRAFY